MTATHHHAATTSRSLCRNYAFVLCFACCVAAPAIEVTAPTTGVVLRHGDPGLAVRWTPSLAAGTLVAVWLVRNGTPVQQLSAGVDDSAGAYDWPGPVPEAWSPGVDYRVRVQQAGGPAFGLSATFVIDSQTPTFITISEPGIDDVWWTGRDDATVSWDPTGGDEVVELRLERWTGSTWQTAGIIASATENDGAFDLPPIPADWGTGTIMRVRAVSGGIAGATGDFALIAADPGIIRGPVSDLVPLTQLPVDAAYKGMGGGLYGASGNRPPADHEALARIALGGVTPRNAEGQHDVEGKTVMISIGYSNSSQEFAAFVTAAAADARRDPRLVIIDGAQGSRDAQAWGSNAADSDSWQVLDQRLAAAGVTAAQVQVLWLKQAVRLPHLVGPWPAHGEAWRNEMGIILRSIASRFPNLRLCYLATRTYGGWYEGYPAAPEPYGYELGFAARDLINAQIAGAAGLRHGFDGSPREVPLLLWGPYLWADGEQPRFDGVVWPREYFEQDGIHPAAAGEAQVASLLRDGFADDPLARDWYLAPSARTQRRIEIAIEGPVVPEPVDVHREGGPTVPTWSLQPARFWGDTDVDHDHRLTPRLDPDG